ncbi:hypothetical protein LCGC14_0456650 [marine sediment metagenome]|uniref:Uncharacterized protein n=1 Tax=marine sediment metagenome TaxID=412755 RepID=A0A0F9VQ47_9ZZZZ
MENQTKPTVGAKAYELLSQPAEAINIIDIQREADKEFVKEMEEIIRTHKEFATKYYIQIILKKEPLMENVIRRYFIKRHSPPDADYDTTLYSYDNEKEQLYFHWTVPDPTSCHYLLTHESSLPAEEKPLLEMVKKFSVGMLA